MPIMVKYDRRRPRLFPSFQCIIARDFTFFSNLCQQRLEEPLPSTMKLSTLYIISAAMGTALAAQPYNRARCMKEHGGQRSWPCKDGCNTCTCGPTGILSTLKACVGSAPPPPPPTSGSAYEQSECIEAHGGKQTWTCADGFNTCRCGRAGIESTKKNGESDENYESK